MIIFGWRGIESTKDDGVFFCPDCGEESTYRRRSVRNWFTLFFIPVIPLEHLGEYIQCDYCKGSYTPEVLDYDPRRQLEMIQEEYHNVLLFLMATMIGRTANVTKNEIELACNLYATNTSSQISQTEMQEIIYDVKSSTTEALQRTEQLSDHLKDEARESLLQAAMLIALSDGPIQEAERAYLVQIGQALGMSKAHFEGVLSSLQQVDEVPVKVIENTQK